MTASRRTYVPDGRLYVAGLPIIKADVDDAVVRILADGRARTATVYAFINGYSATLRRTVPAYAELLASDHVTPLPDGTPLAIGALLTGSGRVGRSPGPDVFEAACAEAAKTGEIFHLLGGMPGTADLLANVLRDRYPGLRIVGAQTPPLGEWTPEQNEVLLRGISDSDADVVWLGVSAPRQEIWACANLDQVCRPIVCVGAAFDFLSGNKPRAPRWMRSIGMEWLFRLADEPGRLWKRYLVGNSRFLLDLIHYGSEPPK
jgi:N-acetylglucosaminyldiphosphoundecaprenol N-acetyl-beta-D-mannosaminyltransferase